MGKARAKRNKNLGGKSKEESFKHSKGNENSPRKYDKDTAVFISMSQELKDDGNKLFQRRDYEGAVLKYEKAIKLLPGNHIDVSYLRSNLAACYMQMGLTEYPKAIHECNLALEVTPKYSKALLKRSRCYEALNRLDFSLRDVKTVLNMEPNNMMASEIAERVKTAIDQRGTSLDDIPFQVVPVTEYVEPSLSKRKTRKKGRRKVEGNKQDEISDGEKPGHRPEETMTGDGCESNNNDSSQEKPADRIEVKKSKEIMLEGSLEGCEPGSIAENDINLKGRGKIVCCGTEKMAAHSTEDNLSDAAETEVNNFEKKLRSIFENKIAETSDGTKPIISNIGKKIKHGLLKKPDLLEIGLGENKAEIVVDLKIRGNLNKAEMTQDIDGTKINGENSLEDKMLEVNKVEDLIEDKKAEDKVVVKEKIANTTDAGPSRTLKLVYGEDIRWAQVPVNCSILRLREIIQDRFPNCRAVLVKYRDQEGDLVTITSTEELRWAEASAEHNSVRLYIFEVNPEQDPFSYMEKKDEEVLKFDARHCNIISNGGAGRSKELPNKPCCIEDWIVQFAHIFKDHVGFDSDAYLDLHEVGMKVYSEAMEETVTSEEAQDLFYFATERFQEMAAFALFNCGNVHMSRARKRVYFTEDHSEESVLEQVRSAFVWAQDEYTKAGVRYEEALKIKTDFYEAVLALGQQQFEQAKLSWYYAISTNVDLESWPYLEVLQLYNSAEENMERGMQMWQKAEERRLTELSHPSKSKALLQKMKLEDFLKDLSADEAAQLAATMRSQINLLWGTLLYERSLMEFKLGLPVWHECLEFAVEKFELAGASPTDIAVMIKNHCSNDDATQGMGFNIDEIVQAWNEMHEAKRWERGIPSFRLEPLLRRRVSKIYHALEHI